MMKKMLVMAMVIAFAAPVFAGDKHEGNHGPRSFGPRQEMMQNNPELAAKIEAQK